MKNLCHNCNAILSLEDSKKEILCPDCRDFIDSNKPIFREITPEEEEQYRQAMSELTYEDL